MTITFDPIRVMVEQPFVGFDGFGMNPAIAEQPSAAMRDRVFAAGESEGAPSALQRLVAPARVEKGFSQLTVEPGRIRVVPVFLAQKVQTVVQRASVEGAGETKTIDH